MRDLAMLIGAGAMLFGAMAPAWAGENMKVFSSPTCGCCAAWVRHVEEAGYRPKVRHLAAADLYAKKQEAGFGPDQVSCHTALVGGYAIEGHVPAAEIDRLIEAQPDAVGLTVPGMPADAPGMGSGDTPFEVLLVKRDGTTEVFARYPR